MIQNIKKESIFIKITGKVFDTPQNVSLFSLQNLLQEENKLGRLNWIHPFP
jgi:hypothetical protein